MDTVMYLYRRDAGETHWGSYILRNDDHGETMLSRMKEELGAGEYRVMVKGYKDHIRGQFSVAASCEGEGCPVKEACDPDTVEHSIPRMRGYGAACVAQMGDILGAVPESTRSIFVTQKDYCSLPDNARYAWEFYYNYWDGLLGWEDLAWGAGEDYIYTQWNADDGADATFVCADVR